MEIKNPSYIHGPIGFQFNYQTVPERLLYLAKKYGDKEVYVFIHPDGRRDSITASELYKKSRELAYSLMTLGIRTGDIVASCLDNELDLLVCTFATICTGAIILNTGIAIEDGSDLKQTLNKLSVKCLVVNPGQNNERFKTCLNFLTNLKPDGSVECSSVPSLKTFISTAAVEGRKLLQLSDLYTDPGNSFKLPRLEPEMTIVLLATSGSTGESKFVAHSHHDAMMIGHHLQESIGYQPDDVIYSERRIAWLGGFPFMYLHDGVKVVTKSQPSKNILDHCDFTYNVMLQEKCTIAAIFPATIIGLVEKINKMPSFPNFILKGIHVGGLPIASVCMNAIGVLSESVTNAYGSTELGFATFNRVRSKDEYLNHCAGKPHGGFEIKVVDNNGFVVERGETGNVYVRSPCFFRYYGDEQKTKEALTVTKWMNTDDIGNITEDGQLVINGRQKDIILQGGSNMIPAKIEAIIKMHPDVFDVVVIAIPDDIQFELACACVIPFPGKTLTTDDVETFYNKGVLSSVKEAFSYNKPGLFQIFEKFPTLYTGKTNKAALKKEVLARLRKQ